ncbi:porin [Cohaesibacter celericrescens]|uniref:porin n=1 Tax=Cohaesibacter celericrescens TaxID=2067669 RepID=UPI0035638FEE
MNIKSLILGSAAAIVAVGSAQAADLPVAEPVDYVRVCDAYGAGYFFIPGTDTCLKISGSVLFAVDSHGFMRETSDLPAGDRSASYDRGEDLINFYTETNITFDAKEETELGTLAAHVELDSSVSGSGGTDDDAADIAIDKAYLTLGGFYAGITDSLINFNAGYGYDDFAFDHGDLNAIGYHADMGNGVTASIALEEFTGNPASDSYDAAPVVGFSDDNANGVQDAGEADIVGTATNTVNAAAGTSMPALAARVKVSQGWGEAQIGGAVFQVRYNDPSFSTDMGYSIGGKALFNIAEGLKFGIAGGYSLGGVLPASETFTFADRSVFTARSAVAGTLNAGWAISTGLEYAFADNFTVYADAGIEGFDDRTITNADAQVWGTSLKLAYVPVKHLSISGKVGYQKVDYSSNINATGHKDWDAVAARLEIERTF